MELMIEKTQIKNEVSDKNGTYTDVAEWEACEVNEDGEVTAITFNKKDISKIDLKFCPPTVTALCFYRSVVPTDLDYSVLPDSLRFLDIVQNSIKGTMDFQKLPKYLQELDASDNMLGSITALIDLPKTLEELDVSDNTLEGSLTLYPMHSALKVIKLSDNWVNGELDLTKVSKTLKELYLDNNRLDGYVILSDVPVTCTFGLPLLSVEGHVSAVWKTSNQLQVTFDDDCDGIESKVEYYSIIDAPHDLSNLIDIHDTTCEISAFHEIDDLAPSGPIGDIEVTVSCSENVASVYVSAVKNSFDGFVLNNVDRKTSL